MKTRLLLIILLLLQLGACSRVQIVYRQLDWLLPLYLEDYFGFDDRQQQFVDQQVELLLRWHCGSQLRDYALLLRQANEDVQARRMDRERLQHYSDRIQALWANIIEQLTPPLTELLRSTSDAQVKELFETFADNNAEASEDFTGIALAELQQQQQQRMAERLETWFRVLNRAQRQALQRWSEQFQPMGEQGLAMRQRWQAGLYQALKQRDSDQFQADITRLFSQPRERYPDAYRRQLDRNWALTIDMIHAVIKHMDADQYDYLAQAMASYAQDFEEMACVGADTRPPS